MYPLTQDIFFVAHPTKDVKFVKAIVVINFQKITNTTQQLVTDHIAQQ